MTNKRPILKAQERKILGRKIKALRREGIIPAHLFGAKIKSESIQIGTADFDKVYSEAGETGLIDLTLGSGKARPVLVSGTARHPVTSQLLHVDFRQVSLTEKIKVEVPIVTLGEAPAVAQNVGVLLQPLSTVEVEAIPEDLPEHIEVDISKLTEVDQEIKVGDLKTDSRIAILAEPGEVVVKIGPLVTAEMEKEIEEEAIAAETAKAEAVTEVGEAGEAEAPSEVTPVAEAPPEEGQKEDQKQGE